VPHHGVVIGGSDPPRWGARISVEADAALVAACARTVRHQPCEGSRPTCALRHDLLVGVRAVPGARPAEVGELDDQIAWLAAFQHLDIDAVHD